MNRRTVTRFLSRLELAFPEFAKNLGDGSELVLEHVLPPASERELEELERAVGVPLPESYKSLLRCARGFWLLGGVIQLGTQHPFFHDFEPLESLTPAQQAGIATKGAEWPPPSQGMLCFAECFLEADGDQVLFDVERGLAKGEYPIVYYAHEVPCVRRRASSLAAFLADLLEDPALK